MSSDTQLREALATIDLSALQSSLSLSRFCVVLHKQAFCACSSIRKQWPHLSMYIRL